MEKKNLKSSLNDEVDIRQLAEWIGRGIKRAGSSVIYGLAFIRNIFFQHLIFFSVIIVIGLALGFFYSEVLKKEFYRSTLILNCTFLNTQILGNTIQTLNLLCEEDDKAGLKRELSLSDSIAKEIIGFEYKTFVSENDVIEMEVLKEQLNNLAEEKKDIVDKIIARLSIENKDAYQITAIVSDPNVLKPLEHALVAYFRKSSYVQKRIEATTKIRTDRRQKLIIESKKLDSLKRLIFGNLVTLSKTERGSNNVILDSESTGNPLEVFREDLLINEEILNIDRQIYLQPDFELMEGFTAINRPASPSLLKILAIALVISFVTGYFILFFWRFDRMLAGYAKQLA